LGDGTAWTGNGYKLKGEKGEGEKEEEGKNGRKGIGTRCHTDTFSHSLPWIRPQFVIKSLDRPIEPPVSMLVVWNWCCPQVAPGIFF